MRPVTVIWRGVRVICPRAVVALEFADAAAAEDRRITELVRLKRARNAANKRAKRAERKKREIASAQSAKAGA